MAFQPVSAEAPTTVNTSVARTRNYLTGAEVETLMAAARKVSRYGHRDATMILIGYRHGLRAGELCDLQWHQVELSAGRLHVRRSKRGTPSVHPLDNVSAAERSIIRRAATLTVELERLEAKFAVAGEASVQDLAVQFRSVMESAMLILHCGRPYGTDSSRQRQDHARRPSCYTAIEGFDPRARQPLRS